MKFEQSVYFLHIPKTAGTSLRVWLENQYNTEEICPAYTLYEALQIDAKQLQRYRLYRGHMGHAFTQLLDVPPFTLTILRNPVNRVISHFEYIKRDENHPLFRYINDNQLSLGDFVHQHPRPNFVDDMQTRALTDNLEQFTLRALMAQSDSLGEFEKELRRHRSKLPAELRLEQAIQRLQKLSVVGTLERFDDTLQLLSYHFGALPSPVNYQLNTNQAKTLYDEQLQEIILARNPCDSELHRVAGERLESDYRSMINELLMDRQLRRCLSDLPKPDATQVLAMTDALVGENWYQREHIDDVGFYRWTGPNESATVVLNLHPKHNYDVQIVVLDAVTPELLQSVRLFHNGILLSHRLTEQDGRRVLQACIAAGSIMDDYRSILTIRVPRTERVSHGYGGIAETGHRYCGLAITEIRCRPVTH